MRSDSLKRKLERVSPMPQRNVRRKENTPSVEPEEDGDAETDSNPEAPLHPPTSTLSSATRFDSKIPFKYGAQRLRSELNEIRLLELLPGREDERIECRLSTQLLPNQPQYEALSYCWGKADCRNEITCDGTRFEVTSNLFRALKCFRHTDRSRILWVDAICINQDDQGEKSNQIPLMGDIYRTCRQCLVWLGDDSNGKAADFLDSLGRRVAGYSHSLNRTGYAEERKTRLVNQHLTTLAVSYRNEFKTKEFEESWMDVIRLLRSPWWSRCWVVQEFLLARQVSIFYGPFQMSWMPFAAILHVVQAIYKQIIKRCLSGDDLHAMLTADLTRAFALIQQTTNPGYAEGKRSLTALLEDSRRRECSEIHDHVYAFLSLTDNYRIEPKYNSPIAEVFLDTAQKIILHDQKLDILSHVGRVCNRSIPALPSWVPDWSAERKGSEMLLYTNCRRRRVLQYFDRGEYCASGELDANATFFTISHNHVLRVQCVILDQVATPTTLEMDSMEYGDREARWRAIAHHNSEDAKCFPGESIASAVTDTSLLGMGMGIIRECGLSDIHRACDMVQESDDELVQESDDDDDDDDDDDKEEDERARNREIVKRLRGLVQETMKGEWRFFRSPNGYLGLVRPEVQYTDVICVLLGASVPYVLRRQGDSYTLIGEAYVHGMMHGRAIDLLNADELDANKLYTMSIDIV